MKQFAPFPSTVGERKRRQRLKGVMFTEVGEGGKGGCSAQRPGRARGRQSKGTTVDDRLPLPPPLALRRSARRRRQPCLDSGAILCCYDNSVGFLVGARRQQLRGNQHWRQRLCPFAAVVKAFPNDGEMFPLTSQDATGRPWDFRAITPGSDLHLSHHDEPGSSVER